MECTQTESEGLNRMFRVVVPAATLEAQLSAKIEEVRPKVQIKGFRPGMVPASHIRKVYGPSMIREIIDEQLQRGARQAIADAAVRVASEPHLHLEADIEQVAAGQADLAFHFHVEVMPDFEPVDPHTLVVERLHAPVEDSEVEAALQQLAASNRVFEAKDGPAVEGDALVINFLGKIDGEPFEGGAAEGAEVVIGAKRFIPGFEEQLAGLSKGDEKVLQVQFPQDYPVDRLKGADATFDVTVSEVRAPAATVLDDAFAKQMGFDQLDDVRAALRQRLEGEHANQSRSKAKRVLFDQLDAQHDFELPKGMVDAEFNQIWSQIEADRKAGRLDEEDAAKTPEALEGEYRRIAERRVRLGLVLAEIGRRNAVEIPEQEVMNALGEQARRFPGQEREVVEFYRKNPNALAQIRAPLYEEKVVDFILELAKVSVVHVSRETLFAEDDTPPAAGAGAETGAESIDSTS